MIKVMIVDDDYLVRMDLRTRIDWSNHGYKLVEDAINGMDALDKIQHHHPDILIMDMEMPKMNGIELLHKLNENNDSIKVIVLSCHDDFNNVKEAMRLGAVDYILKHNYKKEKLVEVLSQTTKQILKEKDETKALRDIRILAKRKQLWDVFNGIKSPSLEFMANLFDVEPDEVTLSKYMVTVFSVDQVHKLTSSELMGVETAINAYYTEQQGCIFIAEQKNRYLLLHKYEHVYSIMVIYDKLMKEVMTLRERLPTLSKITLTYGMSSMFESEKELLHQYQHASVVLDYKYYVGYNQIISPLDIVAFTNTPSFTTNQLQQQLKSFLFETEEIDQAVNGFYKDLMDEKLSIDEMMKIRILIKDEVFKLISQYGADQRHIMKQYELLRSSEIVKEDRDALSQLMTISRQYILDTKGSSSDHMIEAMLTNIKIHYNQPISLNTYADQYFVSIGHLSHLFKKSTGKTFVDYLNAYRIERAKALLLQKNIRIYEVADEVGFSNYRYFTKIFKTYVNVTPKAYIELMKIGS